METIDVDFVDVQFVNIKGKFSKINRPWRDSSKWEEIF